MGWFSSESDQAQSYDQYSNTQQHHQASLTHEVFAGAAAYAATKAYEDHCAKNGRPDNHAQAKEILAAAAGAFMDREIETKGLDWLDRREAQRQVTQQINEQVTVENFNNYSNDY